MTVTDRTGRRWAIPAAQSLQASAMLLRRLEGRDGQHPIDELVASAPLLFLLSAIRALAPEDRRRYRGKSLVAEFDRRDIETLASGWWGRGG